MQVRRATTTAPDTAGSGAIGLPPAIVTPSSVIQSMYTSRERQPRTLEPSGFAGAESLHISRPGTSGATIAGIPVENVLRPGTAITALPSLSITADVTRLPPSVVHSTGPMLNSFIPPPPKNSVAIGKIIPLSNPLASDMTRPATRCSARKSCLEGLEASLGTGIPPNLKAVAQTFANNLTGPSGPTFLTGASISSALMELDITDVIVCDGFFTLLDIEHNNRIPLSRAVGVIDLLVNGVHRKRIREACFALFDINGYITKGHLVTMRTVHPSEFEAVAAKGITPTMIRALMSVINDIMRLEEEEFVLAMMKGKKGGKKKPPPLRVGQKTHIPTSRRRREHIPFSVFDRYMDQSPELVAAFIPKIVGTLLSEGSLQHSCVTHMPRMKPPPPPAPPQDL